VLFVFGRSLYPPGRRHTFPPFTLSLLPRISSFQITCTSLARCRHSLTFFPASEIAISLHCNLVDLLILYCITKASPMSHVFILNRSPISIEEPGEQCTVVFALASECLWRVKGLLQLSMQRRQCIVFQIPPCLYTRIILALFPDPPRPASSLVPHVCPTLSTNFFN
jgi:hypothetical protein